METVPSASLASAWERMSEEIHTVHKAVARGESYMGMQGSSLTQYLVSLRANENLYLQLMLRSQTSSEAPGGSGFRDPSPWSTQIAAPQSCSTEGAARSSQLPDPVAEGSAPQHHVSKIEERQPEQPLQPFASEPVQVETADSWAKHQEVTVSLSLPSWTLSGDYVQEAAVEHHGKPVFVKRAEGGASSWETAQVPTLYCYFWDAREGPMDWRGWWIGPEVGGTPVAAFAPEDQRDQTLPPASASIARPGACQHSHPRRTGGGLEQRGAVHEDGGCHRCECYAGQPQPQADHEDGTQVLAHEACEEMMRPPRRGWQVLVLSQETREAVGEELS